MDPSLAPIPLMIAGLLLMLVTLRRFEGFFKENTLFLLFIAGMMLGFASTVLERVLFGMESMGLIIYMAGSAILAEGFKGVAINLARFRFKRAATFFGFGLGIGFGTTAAIAPFFQFANLSYPRAIILPITIAVVYMLLNSATGLVLGAGSARGATLSSLAQAFGIHAIFSLMVWLGAFFSNYQNSICAVIGITTVISAIILYVFSLRLFYWGLPDEDKKKIRRAVRKGM